MFREQLSAVDPLADAVDEAAQKWFESNEARLLLEKLAEASGKSELALEITVSLNVFDDERDHHINCRKRYLT